MTEFFKMDIFFFVTTVAVIVVAVLVCIGLYYVIRILRNVEKVSEEIEEETRLLRGDIEDARQSVRNQGFKISHAVTIVRKSISRFFGKSKKRS